MDNNNMLGALGEKKHLVTGVVIVCAVLSLFLLTKTFNEIRHGDQYPPMNIVSVQGKGEVMMVPDVASLSFTVNETAATVAAAQQKATEKNNKALAYLKEQGIEEKDIKTTGYNINPRYEYQQSGPCTAYSCPPGRSIITGYEVSQTTQVKVRDTSKAGTILSGIGTLNVSSVSGLSFTVDDEESVKAQAREMAIADAKAKAEKLSKNLGVRLGKITSFYEEMPYYPMPMYDNASMGSMEMKEMAAAPELSLGENKVTVTVSVSYEIK